MEPNNNRVTQEEINALLDSAEVEECVLHNKVLVASYKFPSRGGFTVTGKAACIDPVNFSMDIGRKVARQDVEHQLWQLEGYRKQLELSEEGLI